MQCSVSEAALAQRRQRWRRVTQGGFFALFLLAPALNLFRLDLYEGRFWLLGFRLGLGIDAFQAGQLDALGVSLRIFWGAIVPVVAAVALFLTVARRWGRLYCGWLCPHFSVVEWLNGWLQRACGRISLWQRTPRWASGQSPERWAWAIFALGALGMGALWAITLLTYLLPPAVVWGHLLEGSLTPNQARFIGVAWALFVIEFTLARHLFCRFGCAMGLFQSLAWMSRPDALVVTFARQRARECADCQPPSGSACEDACPMRLKPRQVKRMMFACTQCGRCLSACADDQARRGQNPSLIWAVGEDALRETLRQRREAETARPEPPAGPGRPDTASGAALGDHDAPSAASAHTPKRRAAAAPQALV